MTTPTAKLTDAFNAAMTSLVADFGKSVFCKEATGSFKLKFPLIFLHLGMLQSKQADISDLRKKSMIPPTTLSSSVRKLW